ncbi:hemin uptake protein HemP [Ruixingdingia sedimenti]|uniref:Hemin uptake protein HemP n=1 Tax=Ruixingdingia sedimenti TaxID=3073604 RepID=A0ABU1FDH1_9RHOB|nr:hemin uptake protein HemP [Xinfangfangia sp. LG-4]MDR5654911.1 hemin uptake protein HemP [Xinfangfangia sp. LG-4]
MNDTSFSDTRPGPQPVAAPFGVNGAPQHDATELTRGGNLAFIHLNGQVYSLRITRAGKLILTK